VPQLGYFFEELVVLYLIALAGYISKKSRIFSNEADIILTQIILYITLPALILFSLDFPFSTSVLLDFFILIFLSVFSLCMACIIAYIISKKSKLCPKRKGVFQGLIIFGNQGFLGYAICQVLFQEEGIMYAAIFNLFYLVLIWTYGIYIIANNMLEFSWKMIILNPGTIATSIGMIMFFLPVGWPETISYFFKTLGMPTTPLSMLLIGSIVADLDIKKALEMCKDKYIWIVVFIKLLLNPLFIILIGFLNAKYALFNINFTALSVAVLVAAMPSAPTISLYAKKYESDVIYASIGLCVTTLLLPLTLPVLYWLLNLFYTYC